MTVDTKVKLESYVTVDSKVYVPVETVVTVKIVRVTCIIGTGLYTFDTTLAHKFCSIELSQLR